ncbi:MAG: TonB-dependent receptor [Acidobacteriota bacterium]|nr:TonB-dependent receptor [Acidobacteriota bacterium]
MTRLIPLIVLLVAGLASAQETVNNASLSGRVSDPSGATVENAVVSARQLETNQTGTQKTDREGRFRFPYLRIGQYEIAVSKDGFSTVTRAATLTVGAAFEMPVTLQVGSAESNLTVTGEAPLIEAARSQIAGTVSQTEAASLPLNGRNFLDLALLVPGVSPTNTGANQLFAETSAVPGQGISVGSQRNFSNSYIVDGLSANDDAAALSGIFYGLDVVQEFQVVTSGGQAEFGRALGGYINVVTRSGANALHGDLYGYFRNRIFNAANALSHTVLPMTQTQYGASLGGPVARDRTFFFTNFEQRLLNQSGLITIAPANVAAINARLAAVGYQGPLISTGLFPNPVRNENFLAKADHQFSQKDQFSLRYSLYRVDSLNSRNAGALTAVSGSANLYNTDQTVAVSNIRTFTPRLVNETRGQFTSSRLTAPPSDAVGPAVTIAGVATFGTISSSPTARTNQLYEAVDNLSYQAGSHALRIGADFLYNDDTITYPRFFRGSYTFSSLANFLTGAYNNSGFTQTFANSVVPQKNPNIGFYTQDEWKVTPRLTLNLGIRYDLQFLRTIATDTNNISPRAGFAFTPFASGQTVLRGSYGLFYDRVPLRALANALLSAGNTTDPANLSQIGISLSPGQAGAPVFPNILTSLAIPAGVLFNFSTMDRHMQNAYSEQGSFEIEQRLSAASTLSVGYEHLRGLHLIASVNRNVPSCAPAGTNNGCRPDPRFGNNSQYSSLADSHYDGLHVSFVQRPVKWGSFRVSYTFSKALDNVGEFFFSSPTNNFNIWQDYGRSDDDQRHRVVFDGTVHARGFQLSTFLQYYSALPFNITSGTTTIQGTAARPAGRNTGEGFDFFGVSARLSRTFPLTERLKLEALAEAFNLLNRVNGVSLNGVFGTGPTPLSTFRQTTSVGDPRSLQFALRLKF